MTVHYIYDKKPSYSVDQFVNIILICYIVKRIDGGWPHIPNSLQPIPYELIIDFINRYLAKSFDLLIEIVNSLQLVEENY